MSTPAPTVAKGLTPTQWLICVIASIGFAFDIYELLMLPLILRPALMELVGAPPGSEAFQMWLGRLFYIPAFVGGLFGLLGGYMTDRLGRRRVLTWSILLYAFSAFAAGYSTNIWMLLFFRCTTFIGVCVEFVAAVAWLAELFPDPHRREKVLGYTQAFSSIGGLLVAIANEIATTYGPKWFAIMTPGFLAGFGTIAPEHQHEAWRYTLMSGLLPAIPLILIRPFLPESPAWAQKRAAGTLRRPSIAELFSPQLRKTTIVTALMFACSYGAAFGAIQQLPQIIPGLADVKAMVAAETAKMDLPKNEEAAKKARIGKARAIEQKVASQYTKMQEIGGLLGRFLLAFFAVRIASRRGLLRLFQVPGMLVMPVIFAVFLTVENRTYFDIHLEWMLLGKLPVTTMSIGALVAGLFTVAQFSFWGNYLPQAYPVHLRGTGESFAANIGGRMLGTSFAWVTATIAGLKATPGETPAMKFAYTAAGVALFVYVCGFGLSFFLPEPKPGAEDE
ncbi:MAG: MFS transporter [Planctomycetes bacterium]|nr:MFS transporter [Planctomycetota bacterium]